MKTTARVMSVGSHTFRGRVPRDAKLKHFKHGGLWAEGCVIFRQGPANLCCDAGDSERTTKYAYRGTYT